jgi:hypothetical protein
LDSGDDWFMNSKLILWIPVVGAFICLVKYDKENGLGPFWAYYQAVMLVVIIWIVAYLQSAH